MHANSLTLPGPAVGALPGPTPVFITFCWQFTASVKKSKALWDKAVEVGAEIKLLESKIRELRVIEERLTDAYAQSVNDSLNQFTAESPSSLCSPPCLGGPFSPPMVMDVEKVAAGEEEALRGIHAQLLLPLMLAAHCIRPLPLPLPLPLPITLPL